MKLSHICLAIASGALSSMSSGHMLRATMLGGEAVDDNSNVDEIVTALSLEVRRKAKSTSTPWIGAIPTNDPASASCGDKVTIYMDDEDSSNRNAFGFNGEAYHGVTMTIGGLGHPISPRRAGGNTLISYCPKQVDTLPRLSHDYAVISASNKCPKNSYRFYKRWDNEDSGNNNHHEGDISPHTNKDSFTIMYFCFVPKQSGKPKWDGLFDGQLIFTKASLANTGSSYQDDEDKRNNNKYGSDYKNYMGRMQQLISHGSNTRMYFGSESPVTVMNFGTKKGCDSIQWQGGITCEFDRNGVKSCKPTKEVGKLAKDIVRYLGCMW